ncbi:DUF5302 domain-containing protein [Jatrophihabitans cynanchi]|jgi:hypothetical protein|uniref:DUF5302 domain-containing protein n=1 Tax=Jatrophihabitans cynanchi TaxID=2944128 RepID=A0ABY7JU96_9ACTN|nr:DUF5302 domain-containing protein [Jatrophihabitans sp. SB3-54]WAX55939.1 DUF5302 domain-containing protein [Jatrophihabitans sp. SB3-54]
MPDNDAKAGGDTDDPKAKFREALERKRHHQAERAAETHGESKIHEAHGAAGAKRTFRRKSG